jgi:hypothetical protein
VQSASRSRPFPARSRHPDTSTIITFLPACRRDGAVWMRRTLLAYRSSLRLELAHLHAAKTMTLGASSERGMQGLLDAAHLGSSKTNMRVCCGLGSALSQRRRKEFAVLRSWMQGWIRDVAASKTRAPLFTSNTSCSPPRVFRPVSVNRPSDDATQACTQCRALRTNDTPPDVRSHPKSGSSRRRACLGLRWPSHKVSEADIPFSSPILASVPLPVGSPTPLALVDCIPCVESSSATTRTRPNTRSSRRTWSRSPALAQASTSVPLQDLRDGDNIPTAVAQDDELPLDALARVQAADMCQVERIEAAATHLEERASEHDVEVRLLRKV